MTYTHNQWSALFAAAPAGAGVPLPDGRSLVVEIAKVTAANVDGSPAPVWVDITAKVASIDFLTGDTSGAVSRWPVEQWSITTADLTGLLGDFIDLTASATSTAPAPGSFVRWGTIGPGGWQPGQSGLIETIEEIVAGRVRGWRLQCFGTLLYYAGVEWIRGDSPLRLGLATSHIGNQLRGDTGEIPWPWADTMTAVDPAIYGEIGSYIPDRANKLGFLHSLVDVCGQRIVNTPTGGFLTEPWSAAVASSVVFCDEVVAGTIAGQPLWIRSQDRTAGMIALITGGWSPTAVVDAQILAKWGPRSDLIGFPKTDLGGPNSTVTRAALLALAVPLIAHELRLDRIDCDTTRDAAVWSLLGPTSRVWTSSTPTFRRRRPGATALDAQVFITAVAGTIHFATGRARAKLSYFTRLV